MNCILPPELTDLQLYMALENDVEVEVIEHLAACSHCRQRASVLAVVQDKLRNQLEGRLHRPFCPETDTLRDYYFRLLSQAEMATVTQHLSSCPDCTRELFVDYASSVDVPPTASERSGLTEQIQLWVGKLLGVGGRGLTPALGLRNAPTDTQEEPRIYQVGNVQIALELEPSFDNQDESMLVGLISGMEITQMEAFLWCDSSLVATTPVDATGSFEFPDTQLPSDLCDLILSEPDIKIHLPGIFVPQD